MKRSSVLPSLPPRLTRISEPFYAFVRWSLIAAVVGALVGLLGTAFHFSIQYVTSLRETYPFLLYFLPFGGILIVFLYRACGVYESKGTDLVISAVRTEERVPFRMAPLIFISTVLTHLFGGSAGREGAALQLGGSLGQWVGRGLRLDEKDMHIITMCGMSACFSALFGTPLAAAVFSMEVVSVGVMYYTALVPCALASLIASGIAAAFGAAPTCFTVREALQAPALLPLLQTAVLAALCAAVSVLFCSALHYAGRLFRSVFKNPYLRIFFGGAAVAALALLFGRDYLGAGIPVIERAVDGQALPWAFLLKVLFTALTLGSGFKGGEIVPSFFVGATFGCFAGGLLGLPPSFAAALGLCAVFCGVTNSPLTSLLIAFELFGFSGEGYFLLAIAVSYMLSGYYGLYSQQKIIYSKYKPVFIDRTAQ